MRSPELDRDGADPDLDDSGWDLVEVPGHWAQASSFGDADGPVIHRRRFRADAPEAPRRAWLRFDGILSDAEVWLDGDHLGDVGLYFAAHRFDVTEHLRRPPGPDTGLEPGEHLLAVEVSCHRPRGAKRALTGSLQSGALAPGGGSPGGIWQPVSITTTGPVAIVAARLLCTAADEERAELHFRVVLDAATAGQVRIDTSIVGPDGATAGGVASHDVASGENRIDWTSVVQEPRLWWPASLGDQPRYDVGIAVRSDDASGPSDRWHWRTGLRTVAVDDLQWRANGRRLFVKGVSVGPHHHFLGAVPSGRFVEDVQAVRDAGLDLIRVHGHISRPELYRAADDLGVLVWQDLPLVGTYGTGARRAARDAARSAIDLLGHHPCIAAWCGHEEPNGPPLPEPVEPVEPVSRLSRRLARHLLPSWNRTVLDPLIRRELRSADPTRPVITRSGSLPSPTDRSVSDAHLWLGWRAGRPEDLAGLLRRWPRLGAFIGAIGAQSVAVDDWPSDAPTWPGAERGGFERYVPRGAYGDGVSWAEATRAYQADVLRIQIETVRRLKYQPTGGFCVVALFDTAADGGFGVLDLDRRPKPAFDVLTDCCRPVVVIADRPPPVVTPGQRLQLAVHAVNDLHRDVGPARISARAQLGPWLVERRWEGRLAADSCSFIASLDLTVPELTGALVIDFELEAGEQVATNRYQTVVIPLSEATTRPTAGPRSG